MDKKIVFAKIQVVEGKENECLTLIAPLIKAVSSEQGNLVYSVYQNIVNSSEFLIYEEYINEEAFIEHCSTKHFQFFGEKVKPFLAKDVEIKMF